jgi:hypothetical protein
LARAAWLRIISILFALACIYMGFVQSAFMLVLGFIAIRMLGQGSLSLVSQNVMNQWWVRKRGMVMGISGTVLALMGMGVFPLVHQCPGGCLRLAQRVHAAGRNAVPGDDAPSASCSFAAARRPITFIRMERLYRTGFPAAVSIWMLKRIGR